MALNISFDQGVQSPLNSSADRNISNIISMLDSPQPDSECLPDTEPVQILQDVVAYVEVRSKNENRSNAVCHQLRQMGAEVVDKLAPGVTHVIWKEGKPSTRDRAKKKGIHVVTVLWVASCKQHGEKVSESLFSVTNTKENNTPLLLNKNKKAKSMQPNDFASEVANSADRGQKKRKRQETADRFKMLQTPRGGTPISNPRFYVAETQRRSPFSPNTPNITVPDTPPSMRAHMESLKRAKEKKDSEIRSASYCTSPPAKETDNNLFSPVCAKPGKSPPHKRLFASPDLRPAGSDKLSSPEPTVPTYEQISSKKCDQKDADGSSNSSMDKTISRKPSRKRKLLTLNEDPTPELLKPTIASNAGQTKPSILPCGNKKKVSKTVTYLSDHKEISVSANKRRKISTSNIVHDDNSSNKEIDSSVRSGQTETQKSSAQIKSSKRRSVSFRTQKSLSVGDEMEKTESEKSAAQFSAAKSRRKSVATCQNLCAEEQTSLRRSRRKSVLVSSQSLSDKGAGVGLKENDTVAPLRQIKNKSSDSHIGKRKSDSESEKGSKCRTETSQKGNCESGSSSRNTTLKNKEKSSNDTQISNKSLEVKSLKPKVTLNASINRLPRRSSSSERKIDSRQDKRKWLKQEISQADHCSQENQQTMVMTSLHYDEQEIVVSVAKKLGGFKVVDKVTSNTTHVICGSNRRTLNVLHAIAHGCWMLSLEWVYQSLEAGKWIPEEEYEQHQLFPAVQTSRLLRESDRNNQLFKAEGPIYVSDQSTPPKVHLEQLITTCGGKVTSMARKAKLCVGTTVKSETPTVSEQWILDSVTAFEILPLQGYQHNQPRQTREPSPDY